jgi:NAD(P)-dependent dehydrogenase (short-subunit alcohol dehydrogenase family)
MGAKRIIMAVRTPSKGETALAAIRRETQRRDVGEVWELDLTSFNSVETFVKRISELDRLDALIANAGVVMGRFQTVQGLELSLLVNVVATMLLAFRALG